MDQVGMYGNVTTLIHFVFSSGSEWRIACMPNMTEFHKTDYHPHYQRTDDPRAATCPACKRTEEFKKKMEAVGGR